MKKTDNKAFYSGQQQDSAGNGTPMNKSKRLIWSAVFLIIAAATIWVVVSQSRSFSAGSFMDYIGGASKPWLCAAVLCMLGFIVFEGGAISAACRAFGYSFGGGKGFIYSAADIYFSAITPSATGGQPACAYFMIKDGIPGVVTTIGLLINLVMYTMSIIILALLTIVLKPQVFLGLSTLSKVFIILGYFIQGTFVSILILILKKRDLLYRMCRRVLHFLCRIRLLKNEEEKQNKLVKSMEEYAAYAEMAKDHKKAMLKVLLFNLLQRASVISVPLFVFLAAGGDPVNASAVWATQCYVVIGSNSMPIPGAMGVTDFIMLDGFGKLMSQQNAVNFELLSRALSFYVCVILCGITIAVKYLIQKKRSRNNDRNI